MELQNIFKASTESNHLSELNNPFTRDCVEVIRFRIDKDWEGNPQFKAYIEFKNGKTSGQQDLKAGSFAEIVKKVESFIGELK